VRLARSYSKQLTDAADGADAPVKTAWD
jgi:hypothetical protein